MDDEHFAYELRSQRAQLSQLRTIRDQLVARVNTLQHALHMQALSVAAAQDAATALDRQPANQRATNHARQILERFERNPPGQFQVARVVDSDDDDDADGNVERLLEELRGRPRQQYGEVQRLSDMMPGPGLILLQPSLRSSIQGGMFAIGVGGGSTNSRIGALDDMLLQRVIELSMREAENAPPKIPGISSKTKEILNTFQMTAAIQARLNKSGDAGSSMSGSKIDCAICQDPLIIGTRCTELPCKHCFCCYCILEWLEKTRTCPICRHEVVEEERYGYITAEPQVRATMQLSKKPVNHSTVTARTHGVPEATPSPPHTTNAASTTQPTASASSPYTRRDFGARQSRPISPPPSSDEDDEDNSVLDRWNARRESRLAELRYQRQRLSGSTDRPAPQASPERRTTTVSQRSPAYNTSSSDQASAPSSALRLVQSFRESQAQPAPSSNMPSQQHSALGTPSRTVSTPGSTAGASPSAPLPPPRRTSSIPRPDGDSDDGPTRNGLTQADRNIIARLTGGVARRTSALANTAQTSSMPPTSHSTSASATSGVPRAQAARSTPVTSMSAAAAAESRTAQRLRNSTRTQRR